MKDKRFAFFFINIYPMASVGTQSSGSEKMLQKSQGLPSLQSIKSLPIGVRFMRSPTSDRLEKTDAVNTENSDAIRLSITENDHLGNGVTEEVEDSAQNDGNEDSPYSVNAISVEDRPSAGDDDLDTVAAPSPSILMSRDHRWTDTTSYAAKKVLSNEWNYFMV